MSKKLPNLLKKPGVHKIFWEFRKKFVKIINVGRARYIDPKCKQSKYYLQREEWRWAGYDLMKRIEKWAEKYPKDVYVCSVDDEGFAGADLVMILHRTRTSFMGVSCFLITQNTPKNEDPRTACFFLYPCDMKSIHDAFHKIEKIMEKYPKSVLL